jgi:hypothetical protein
VYWPIHVSLEAERTRHAYILVLDLLAEHLRRHQGSWPGTWNELKHTSPVNPSNVYRWPEDLVEIKRRVHVDFGLTVVDVAEMTPNCFTAVQQIGPNYGASEYWIDNVLRAAKSFSIPSTDDDHSSPTAETTIGGR